MAVSKYKTKKGVRWRVEVYQDGERTAYQAGFKSRLEALQWEKDTQSQTSSSTPSVLGLSEVVTLYLLDIEKHQKKNTLVYKKSVFRRFVSFISAETPFPDIDRKGVKRFLDHIATSISPKSANKHRKDLSVLWTWAQTEGHATSNPVRQIPLFPVTRHIRYVPPKEHIQKALGVASQFEKDWL